MRKTGRIVGAIVLFSAFSLAGPQAGAGQGRGRGQANKAEKAERKADKKDEKIDKRNDKRDDKTRTIVDREGHIRVIRDYARGGSLPPGLAKREALPPGLRKQLRERGELPPGLQKRLTPVPSPLAARLPGLPAYYDRYFLGSDLVVVDRRSNRIAALIPNIF
jgi:Ni/Co efflux regulator RcnB